MKWLPSGSLLALTATHKIIINPVNIFGYVAGIKYKAF